MATWKVIALINGEIEAVSGPDAQDRPGAHEWMVWQGQAADKAEALKCAEKANPRVDLEWMRIRYERDLNKRWDLAWPNSIPRFPGDNATPKEPDSLGECRPACTRLHLPG